MTDPNDAEIFAQVDKEQAREARWRAQDNKPLRQALGRNVVIALGLLLLFAGLYQAGLLTSGHEQRRITWDSAISSTSSGTTMGPKSFFVRAGQTVDIDYQATVYRGGLYIWVRRNTLSLNGMVGQVRVTSSGAGKLQVPIQQAGFYRLIIDGSPGGNGYDVAYSATWRVT